MMHPAELLKDLDDQWHPIVRPLYRDAATTIRNLLVELDRVKTERDEWKDKCRKLLYGSPG
jgi:hypothetical protein